MTPEQPDIIERLRKRAGKYDEYDWHSAIELEAAQEIYNLRAALAARAEVLPIDSIINELAAIADACADLHQNRNRGNGEAIMAWDNAKLTLGTIRKARWIRDGKAAPSPRAPIQAHSKTEYKRLKEMGADVMPPLTVEANQPTRCVHGVWLADHCFQCLPQGQR